MNALLIITVGRTDVQFVNEEVRQEFEKKGCASLHEELEACKDDWSLVDSPPVKARERVTRLPDGPFALCTPKLDALLLKAQQEDIQIDEALIFETKRDPNRFSEEPRFAGEIVATRLRERGVSNIRRVAFLVGEEWLEDASIPRDSIIRIAAVERLDQAIRDGLEQSPGLILVAVTGGFPKVEKLVPEIVCLYADPETVQLVNIPEKFRDHGADIADFSEPPIDPGNSFRTRRHVLNLIENGNLLGAWGAAQHLENDEIERSWMVVVKKLAHFAASLPISDEGSLPILKSPLRAVRAAIRVELALLAGDIPRAIHGTVAFFESALWDHLDPHLTKYHDKEKRWFRVDPEPRGELIRANKNDSTKPKDDRSRPFELEMTDGAVRWYKVYDDAVCAVRLASRYLDKPALTNLGKAVESVRSLRNDVAHNEPTPELMASAQEKMRAAHLWSEGNRFLEQPLVVDTLKELGQQNPERLCTDLLAEVRHCLLAPRSTSPGR